MKNKKHTHILDECMKFLSNSGIQMNNQTQGLLEYFFSTDYHMSFDDIKRYVHDKRLQISDSEIRNALELLVEFGFATCKDFGDSIIRYEHLHYGEHHDHFICLKCGKIIEFYSQKIEDEQHNAAIEQGFHAFSHKMQIHGLCESCFGSSSRQTIPLAMVDSGGRFRVAEIAADNAVFETGMKKKLLGMGIVSGMNGEVLTNQGGRIVVIVNNVRMALGPGLSHSVLVYITD